MPVCVNDARPGGKIRYEWTNGKGQGFYLTGEFVELVPFSRIVHVERMHLPDPTPDNHVETRFEPDGDGTLMTMRMTLPSAEVRAAMLSTGMEAGHGGELRPPRDHLRDGVLIARSTRTATRNGPPRLGDGAARRALPATQGQRVEGHHRLPREIGPVWYHPSPALLVRRPGPGPSTVREGTGSTRGGATSPKSCPAYPPT